MTMQSRATVPNALTVDVEEYFQVEALAKTVDRSEWPYLESRVAYGTERLLSLFAREKVRATFFTLGWVATQHKRLVRRIVEEGHELAGGLGLVVHLEIFNLAATQFAALLV